MKYENVQLGADPELFLVTAEGQELRSAIGRIGGNKWNPRPIDDKGSAVQEDNVAVEFNIPPAKTKKEFVHNIGTMLLYLSNYVKEQGLILNIVPAAYFPDKELAHPAALEFGCDPDFDVWSKRENEKPDLPEEYRNLRSCGGHIHVSWDKPERDTQETMIRMMDIFVGCPSIQYDGDLLRRKLYGKAGAFRFKDYGVEYRTPSNFWLREPSLVEWVYDRTMQGIDYLNSGGEIDLSHSDLILDCINNGNEVALFKLQQYYPIG